MNKKGIAVLGSTGSIGTQTLDVVRAFPDLFHVVVLTCGSNATLLVAQALEFLPDAVVIINEEQVDFVKSKLGHTQIAVYSGMQALEEVVQFESVDVVLNAIVGAAGLRPTVKAISCGKDIALANKETLVVAGELVMSLASQYQVKMLPVDSEHSAIFQCLVGEEANPIEKIYITASGWAFSWKRPFDIDFRNKGTCFETSELGNGC